jgi:phosphoribosylglycinamide formyltransferase-1
VRDDDTVESLHERIKTEERRMLVETIGRIARDGFVVEGRTVRFRRSTGRLS